MDSESKILDIRSLEKGSKFGYIFDIAYDGRVFDTFDELKGKKSVKGEFSRIMNELGFTWAKGVQQAGRTDAKVSASSNFLYVSSNYDKDFSRLIERFNSKTEKGLKINRYMKTLPNLVFPDLIESRSYCYSYPKKKIVNDLEKIDKLTKELSGTYDVSIFTDEKGKKLKEKVRSVEIDYRDGSLNYKGSSFMPRQVRIMSSFILTNSYEPLPGKYLTLVGVELKEELRNVLIEKAPEVVEDNLLYAEKMKDLYIFYVDRKKKGEFIGSRGKNIKKLRKKYGNIVVREKVL